MDSKNHIKEIESKAYLSTEYVNSVKLKNDHDFRLQELMKVKPFGNIEKIKESLNGEGN